MHLAQLNIGRVLGGPDDPRMADFYSNLAKINAPRGSHARICLAPKGRNRRQRYGPALAGGSDDERQYVGVGKS